MSHYRFSKTATFEGPYGASLDLTMWIDFDVLPADPSVGINEEDIDVTDVQIEMPGCTFESFEGSLKDDDLRFECWEHLKAERDRELSDYVDRWIDERKDDRHA